MTPRLTLNRRQFVAGSALILLPFKTSAQGTPVTPVRDSLSAAVFLPQLPGKRVNAHFARHVFAPNAEAPLTGRVGSALVMVESGTLTLKSDGAVALRRVGEAGPVSQAEVPAEGVPLGTGDAALVPHGQGMGLANASGEPSILLMLVAHAPYHEFSYVHPTILPEASGVTTSVIGFGTGAFAEVPAIMLLERDVFRPGGSGYSTTFKGVEIGGVASGSARATFQSGSGWTTPGAMDRTKPPVLPGDVQVEAGTIVDLADSDGYVCLDGAITWRATGDGELVVLRAQLIPVPQPES